MGSLLSGWDSPVQDPKLVQMMRNKSLTKEEIEEYWKLNKKTEDEQTEAISSSSEGCSRTRSLPVVDTKDGHLMLGKEVDVNLEKLLNSNCWWTRSNWAFLNEPPVIASEVPKSKYASQYHVARLASSKPDIRIAGV
uniref:DNA-directed RNA polymerase n=1 Tax=Opuntia streptacantha TaxID=393608 RepID=A0A7C9CGL3_OPUST